MSAREYESVRLDPDSIEGLARRISELLRVDEPEPERSSRGETISAKEVAEWWKVSRRWVYDHAEELGVRRLGTGPKPLLRFDPDDVAERLGSPSVERPDAQRSSGMRVTYRTDSLSPRSGANVAEQSNRGRRGVPPAPRPYGRQRG